MEATLTPTSALLLDKLFSEEVLTIDISNTIIFQEMAPCNSILRQCDISNDFFESLNITNTTTISFMRPNFYIKSMHNLRIEVFKTDIIFTYTLEECILERKINIFNSELKILHFNTLSIIHLENDYQMIKEIESDIEISVRNNILKYNNRNIILKRKVDCNDFNIIVNGKKIRKIIEQSFHFYDNLLLVEESIVAFIMKDSNVIFKVFMSI
ncbi:hypothetical protein SLOPH_1041 [Spraguea lophii 42_110]|uniref:Uncharacterized protein n=1 Tax=Spraguea lophii (strain 42_110) TaxID=1358809 RepID=S7W7D1_SPRLO|nr:hypothetical protein SLOPH_1041 [Spraguea lophii 42_110]